MHLVTSDEGDKSSSGKVYAHQMVRTDSREQTLHAFLPPKDFTHTTKRYCCNLSVGNGVTKLG